MGISDKFKGGYGKRKIVGAEMRDNGDIRYRYT